MFLPTAYVNFIHLFSPCVIIALNKKGCWQAFGKKDFMNSRLLDKKKKLSQQITLKTVCVIVIFLLSLITGTLYLTIQRTQKNTVQNLEVLAAKNAGAAERYVDKMNTQAKALAASLAQLKNLPPKEAQQITEDILVSFLEQEDFYGIYVAW